MGGIETFPVQGMRPLRIYEGDSLMLQCGLTQTASAMVVHQPYDQCGITVIDKGGGECLYLEDHDPHPLTMIDDTTMTIQLNGISARSYLRPWSILLYTLQAIEILPHLIRSAA